MKGLKMKKCESIIIKVPDDHSRYLAMRSTLDDSVVACGDDIETVLSRAREAGAQEPMLMFAPKEGQQYIF